MEKSVGGRVQNLTNVEVNHMQVLDQEMLLLKFYNNNFHILPDHDLAFIIRSLLLFTWKIYR